MDYYGTRLATCSSDRSVKIFDVKNGGQILVADLRGWVGRPTRTKDLMVYFEKFKKRVWTTGSICAVVGVIFNGLALSCADTKVQFGRWLGHTPPTVTSWRPALTTEKSSSGEKRTARGIRCTNIRDTTLQVLGGLFSLQWVSIKPWCLWRWLE